MARKGENIHKRKDGRWEGRYIKSRTAEGRIVWGYLYGKSYNDVKQKLIPKKAESGFYHLTDSKLTFEAFSEVWLCSIQRSIKESTYSHYCYTLAHTDIPLLIIHGDEDMKAPLSMAYKLYDSCNGEKQLYIVHGADHTENYRKDPGGYEKIVTKFIEERLRAMSFS